LARNDLNVKDGGWRAYLGWLRVGSLWAISKRGTGGNAKYPGNFSPEIPRNLIPRYTKANDVVADLFAGSETTADVCAELNRVYTGCDLRPYSARTDVGDARTWNPGLPVQMVFLHPPYADIIDYNERLGPRDGDLTLPWQLFLAEFTAVGRNAYNMLEDGGAAVLVMGDLYENKKQVPLGFYAMNAMLAAGFILKGIIVKDFGNEVANKNKNANLWFYRALVGGFFVQEHEYIFVFEKPEQPRRDRRRSGSARLHRRLLVVPVAPGSPVGVPGLVCWSCS
jgi:hypothetical protein